MKELLKEFLSNILMESEGRAKREPGSSWQSTKTKKWSAKRSDGETRSGFGSKKSADAWIAGTGKAPGETELSDKNKKDTTDQSPVVRTPPPERYMGGEQPRIPGVPQSSVIRMSNAPGTTPAAPISPQSAKADNSKLAKLRANMDSIPFDDADHKGRAEAFMGLWQAFISAPTQEEQVKAVEQLIEQNLIQGTVGRSKIYIHPNVGFAPKGMSGEQGTAVTKLMQKIIKERGLALEPQEGSNASAAAAESGPTNEAGVTALLDPTDANNNAYEETKRRYAEVGGDVDEIDRLNKDAATAIESSLPKGAKITSCSQVGGVGSKRLQQLGIDPRTDPTDILLEYEVNGKREVMKISAKIYANPKRITMKNAGLEDAGDTYLGQPEGAAADTLYKQLRAKYSWNKPGMSSKQKEDAKRKFRQEYLTKYSEEMEKLAQSEEGQQRLLEMWQKVHGCGKDVHTLVVNKTSGKSELKSPDHYCSPKLPFKVKYNGTKVVIEMDSEGPETLEINLKTESSGSVKLLFNHVVKTTKTPKVPATKKTKAPVVKKKKGK